MDQSQRHEMILEVTHASGAEEWSCPTCGRRMTITWQPWKKIVLEQGDIYARCTYPKWRRRYMGWLGSQPIG